MRADDFQEDQWIAITDIHPRKQQDEDTIYEAEFGYFGPVFTPHRKDNEPTLDGKPLRIIKISLPFILVNPKGTNHLTPYDTRNFSFTKLNDDYVEIYGGVLMSERIQALKESGDKIRIDADGLATVIVKEHTCPYCRIGTFVTVAANPLYYKCKECGSTCNKKEKYSSSR